MISMLGLYRPRRTPLHATPAWIKVIMLVVISVGTIMIGDPVTSVGIMFACVLLLVSTEPPPRATLWALFATVLVALLSSLLHLLRGDFTRAVDVAADLVGIVALALAVTSSTSMEAMLDFVSKAARPIRFILPPETLGLMFALMLRSIPEVARLYYESRQAARARGLDRSLRAVLFPTTTRTVGFSLQLGQALHARGIGEEAREKRQRRRAKRGSPATRARSGPAGTRPHEGALPPGTVTGDEMTRDEAFELLSSHIKDPNAPQS